MSPRSVLATLTRLVLRDRLLAAELVLLVLAILFLLQCSPAATASRNARASQQFGEALQRLGIETQAGPSK